MYRHFLIRSKVRRLLNSPSRAPSMLHSLRNRMDLPWANAQAAVPGQFLGRERFRARLRRIRNVRRNNSSTNPEDASNGVSAAGGGA